MIQTDWDLIIIVGGGKSSGLHIKPRIDPGFSTLLAGAVELCSWRAG